MIPFTNPFDQSAQGREFHQLVRQFCPGVSLSGMHGQILLPYRPELAITHLNGVVTSTNSHTDGRITVAITDTSIGQSVIMPVFPCYLMNRSASAEECDLQAAGIPGAFCAIRAGFDRKFLSVRRRWLVIFG